MWCRLHAFHYFLLLLRVIWHYARRRLQWDQAFRYKQQGPPNTLLCASAYEYGAQAFIMCCVPTDTPFTSSPA